MREHFTGPKQKAILKDDMYICRCGDNLIWKPDADRLIKNVQNGHPLFVECSEGCWAMNEVE